MLGKFLNLKLLSAKHSTKERALTTEQRWLKYIVRQGPELFDLSGTANNGRWNKTVHRFRSRRGLPNTFPPITHVVGTMVLDGGFTDSVAESLYGCFHSCRVTLTREERTWTFDGVHGLTVIYLACCVVASPAADKLLAMPRTGSAIVSDLMKQKDLINVVAMCELSVQRVLVEVLRQASKQVGDYVLSNFVSMRTWTRLCFSHVSLRYAVILTEIADWDGTSPFNIPAAMPPMLCQMWSVIRYSDNKLQMVKQSGFLLGCALAAFVQRFQERSSTDVRRNQETKLWAALAAGLVKVPVSVFSGPDLPADEGLAFLIDRLDRRLSRKDEAIQEAVAEAFDWIGAHLRRLLTKYTAKDISHEDFTRHFAQAYRFCMGADVRSLDQLKEHSGFSDNGSLYLSDPLDPQYNNEKAHYEFSYDLFCPATDESMAHTRSLKMASRGIQPP